MKTSSFSFELPPELIAQTPPEKRGTARLLVINRSTGTWEHRNMRDFPSLIPPDALVVFNDSRVRKARLYGTARETAGKVEFFLLEYLPQRNLWRCMVTKAKRQRPGKGFHFPGGMEGEIVEKEGTQVLVKFTPSVTDDYLDIYGHIPLPPYIKREDQPQDAERYQTVYSRMIGSVAAPTAGLHFTQEILKDLRERGVETAFVTLHVGMGTFLPIRTESILDHKMHTESFTISEDTAQRVNRAKADGRPVIGVGTTSIRSLESAWKKAQGLVSGNYETDLFIYPGYEFQAVDQVFTNFHTPESTLLVLVSAFGGVELMKKAYEAAVAERYRFFSYGDAMFIV